MMVLFTNKKRVQITTPPSDRHKNYLRDLKLSLFYVKTLTFYINFYFLTQN